MSDALRPDISPLRQLELFADDSVEPGSLAPLGSVAVDPRARFEQLKDERASLNLRLFTFVGQPEHHEAQEIMARQRAITQEIHALKFAPADAARLGAPGGVKDLVVVGAGLAGLSAAITAAADGLDVILVDSAASVGGQAALSSRIENVINDEAGITGRKWVNEALAKAQRLGADVKLGSRVTQLQHDPESGCKRVTFADGQQIMTKAVVLATGLQFNKLDFLGGDCAGVIYGDSEQLERSCGRGETIIVGGGNSAGQAAIDVAQSASRVTILVRSGSLTKSMSADLIEQLENHPRIEVSKGEISRAVSNEQGDLVEVELKDGQTLPCNAVGFFIGATPSVEWAGADLDERGFIKTGANSDVELETSIPGVYAAGDTRSGSKKRTIIAAAEGNQAVSDTYSFCQQIDQQLQLALTADPQWGLTERDASNRSL